MNLRSTFFVMLACLGLFLGRTQADARQQGASASYDDTPEIKKRLLAAVYAAKRPANFDHVGSLIDILKSLEAEFALDLRSRDLIAMAAAREPTLKEMYAPGHAKGIAFYQPIEKARLTDPAMFKRVWFVDAMNLTGICLPQDAAYNLRYIDFLEQRAWPAKMERVRYALYLRMFVRGCVETAEFHKRTQKLVPALLALLKEPTLHAGDAGSILYLLVAGKRFDAVPRETLERFIAAQEVTGTWPSNQIGDAAVVAAQGAYILADMLRRRGVTVSPPELFYAENAPPKISLPVPFH